MKASMKKMLAWTLVLMLMCADIVAIAEGLSELRLPSALKVIGEEAFYGDTSIEKVIVPEGATKIGDKAFANSSIVEIEIPDTVTTISNNAFDGIDTMTVIAPEGSHAETYAKDAGFTFEATLPEANPASDFEYTIENGECTINGYWGDSGRIVIPESIEDCPVTMLGENAFAYFYYPEHTDVSVIEIPDTVNSIHPDAFYRSELISTINVSSGNTKYTSVDGVLFSKDKTRLLAYPGSKDSLIYNVPEGTEIIGGNAFTNAMTTFIVKLPEGLTTIETGAFEYADSIHSVYIPASVTSIGDYTFDEYNCTIYGNSGSYAESYALENDIEFSTDALPEEAETPADQFEYSIVNGECIIEGGPYGGGKVVIPAYIEGVSVTTIKAGIFSEHESLRKVVIPATVTNLEGAFEGARMDIAVEVDADNPVYLSENGSVYSRDKKTLAYYGGKTDTAAIEQALEGIEHIADYALCGRGMQDLELPAGLVSIGAHAFANCWYLTEIVIPDTVTSIKAGAFAGCEELEKAVLPESISEIADETFAWCYELKEVYIPDGVSTIGKRAFYTCDKLPSIYIPKSVSSIAENTFIDCAELTEITVDTANASYTSVDGVLFTKDQKHLLCYPAGKAEARYTVPAGAESIGVEAFFYNPHLMEITISNSVTQVGRSAFTGCNGLTSITIPGSIKTIPSGIFDWCENLTSITLEYGVKTIEEYAFEWCENLADIVIPESVSYIADSAFDTGYWSKDDYTIKGASGSTAQIYAEKFDLQFEVYYAPATDFEYTITNDECTITEYNGTSESLVIPNVINGVPVTAFGENAFSGKTGVTSISIPANISNIASGTFNNCTDLASIIVNEGNTTYMDKDGVLFDKSGTMLLCYPCGNISTSYTVPDGTLTIGAGAFDGCSRLTSVTIPDSVTAIANDSFDDCLNLTISAVEGSYVQEYANANEIAFEVLNPEYTYYIAGNDSCFIRYACLGQDRDNPVECYFHEFNMQIGEGYNEYNGSYTIPTGYFGVPMVAIDDEAFMNSATLSEISIPSTVKTIGASAFNGCVSLNNILLAEGIKEIGSKAFANCASLTEITLPSSIALIADDVFEGCIGLKVRAVEGSYAYTWAQQKGMLSDNQMTPNPETDFSYSILDVNSCEISGYYGSSTDVIIPEKLNGYYVTAIDENAFRWSWNLTSIIIPSSVTSIDAGAFANCRSLRKVSLPDSLKEIPDSLFEECEELKLVNLPSSLEIIGDKAFYRCGNIKLGAFPKNLRRIGDYAFYGIGHLDLSKLPEKLEYLGGMSLQAISNIGSGDGIRISASVKEIGMNPGVFGYTVDPANEYYTSINGSLFTKDMSHMLAYVQQRSDSGTWPTEYIIPEEVETIGGYAFGRAYGLEKITIPNTVKSIGEHAFSDMHGVEFILEDRGNDNNLEIGEAAFSIGGVTEFTLPEGQTKIGSRAFSGSSIQKINYPKNQIEIGAYVFEACYQMKEITIPENVILGEFALAGSMVESVSFEIEPDELPEGLFAGCSNLTSYKIPDSVVSVGDSVFANCWNLKEVEISDGLTEIGAYMFDGCDNLTEIKLPDTITSIKAGAFSGCRSLTEINIPDGVTNIGEKAFCVCDAIQEIYLPDSVLEISDSVFDGCSALRTIRLPSHVDSGCIPFHAFASCPSLRSIALPEGVTYIDGYAFTQCVNLESIYIPASVEGIGYGAFYNCPRTMTIYGEAGSYAESFAEENGYRFKTLSLWEDEPDDAWDDDAGDEGSVGNYSIIGAVVTTSGEAVDGVMVYLYSSSNEDAELLGTAITNASGTWQISGLAACEDASLAFYSTNYTVANNGYVFDINGSVILDPFTAELSATDKETTISFTMNTTEVVSGDEVCFTVNAPGANAVRLVVDGRAYELYYLMEGQATIARAFSSSGIRNIQFQPHSLSGWGQISAAQSLTVTSFGKLAKPTIHPIGTQVMWQGFELSWDAVPDADSYTVYLYHDDVQLWPGDNMQGESKTTDTKITIPGGWLFDEGKYAINLVTSGRNYDSSTGYASFTVRPTAEAVEITQYPANCDIGKTVTIGVACLDKSMYTKLQVLDPNGNPVELTAKDKNTYTFVVSVPGTYKATAYAADEADFSIANAEVTSSTVTVTAGNPQILSVVDRWGQDYAVAYTGETTWVAATVNCEGTVEVFVDGVSKGTVAPEEDNRSEYRYTVGNLPDGKHVVEFKVIYNNYSSETASINLFSITKASSDSRTRYASQPVQMETYPGSNYGYKLAYGDTVVLEGTYGTDYSYVTDGTYWRFVKSEALVENIQVSVDDISYIDIPSNTTVFVGEEISYTIGVTDTASIHKASAIVWYRDTNNESFTETIIGHVHNNLGEYVLQIPVNKEGRYEVSVELESIAGEKTIVPDAYQEFIGISDVNTQTNLYRKDTTDEYILYESPTSLALMNVRVELNMPLKVCGSWGNDWIYVEYNASSGNLFNGFIEADKLSGLKIPGNKKGYILISEDMTTKEAYKYSAAKNKTRINTLFRSMGIDTTIFDHTTASVMDDVLNRISNETEITDTVYLYINAHGEGWGNDFLDSFDMFDGILLGEDIYKDKDIMKALKTVKGNVVLIVESCYSGRFTKWADELGLCEDKFTVLTASNSVEESWMYTALANEYSGGWFTTYLHACCTSSYKADGNKDGLITLNEIKNNMPDTIALWGNYKGKQILGTEEPQYYGNSSNVVFNYK